MTDPIPHNRNRLGYWISIITHPLVVFLPALVVVLNGTDPLEAFAWLTSIGLVILVNAFVMLRQIRRRGQHTYQRESRHRIYLVLWLCMLGYAILAALLHAPTRLVFSLVSLCVWVPLQALINVYLTKISIHVAVISGIMCAFILMGEFATLLGIAAAVVTVSATAWSRMVTGNHTLSQVMLGIGASVASVLLAYILVLY